MGFLEIWIILILISIGAIMWWKSMWFVLDMDESTFLQKITRIILMAVLVSLPIALIMSIAVEAVQVGE